MEALYFKSSLKLELEQRHGISPTSAPPNIYENAQRKIMGSDLFNSLLSLEDKFYDEGFQLGTADGVKVGRIEGRVFGLEKGFEKYVENGRLHGKSLVWISRMHHDHIETTDNCEGSKESNYDDTRPPPAQKAIIQLPRDGSMRLEKHLKVLYALTEPASLSTDNTEDAVTDFDDRLKRASGKMKIVERLVGEKGIPAADSSSRGRRDITIEDANILDVRR